MNPVNSLKLSGKFQPFTQIFTRAFSATSVAVAKHSKRRLKHMMRNVPPYPYPIQYTYKQSWFGLYGGKHIQFGNNVPESNYKTRRSWSPNVRHRTLYSRALDQYFSIDVTASTIDKVGGLDAYLTGTKPARLKTLGPTGWRLRWRLMNSPRYQAQLAQEREALGLPPLAPLRKHTPGKEEAVSKNDPLEEEIEEFVVQNPEAGVVEPETVVQEPEVKIETPKTAAQLMIERIEREKGLRKDPKA